MMSVLFVAMPLRRNNVEGQSMVIAVFKWIGTLAPTIQAYPLTADRLILALGISIFLYNVVYIVMLYRKLRGLGLHPLTRQPVA